MNILNKYTLETLKKNKSRTIVTVIGIILSLAMLSGVTVLIASSQKFLTDVVVKADGNWYGAIYDADPKAAKEIAEDEDISQYFSMQSLGYSKLLNSNNQNKPFLFVGGVTEDFTANMPILLTEGRLPQNTDEIILPDHLLTNGGVEYKTGDTISLDLGQRTIGGKKANQFNPYDLEVQEDFTVEETRTFTVVGIYSRPSFENYSAPGYTALTCFDEGRDYLQDFYILTPMARSIYGVLDRYTAKYSNLSSSAHYDLLRFMGASDEATFNSVLYGLSAVLIAIIVLASISLIYNAFSISVSERTKQFGLLSSIGATKKQLKNSVIFEALTLCCLGIPLGIISGIIGIGVTLRATRGLFAVGFGDISVINGAQAVPTIIPLTPAPWALALAAILGLLTVLISAYIPARKAVKISTIDAVRQTDDIKLTGKAVKVSPLTKKLFGFEGTIAAKNFKRNKKRYRATVISLFLSIVLFISAYSFCDYLSRSVAALVGDVDYDIQFYYYPENFSDDQDADGEKGPHAGKSNQQMFNELRAMPGVTKSGYVYNYFPNLIIETQALTNEYRNSMAPYYPEVLSSDSVNLNSVPIIFTDDENYTAWLEKNNFDKSVYLNPEKPVAMAVNNYKYWDSDLQKYFTVPVFTKGNFTVTLPDNGKVLTVEGCVDNLPFGLKENLLSPVLVLPISSMETVIGGGSAPVEKFGSQMLFKSSNHALTYKKMDDYLAANYGYLNDVAQMVETNRAMIGIINVFAYGFIVLISLIARPTCSTLFPRE